jgi:hypothetical protein
MKPTIFLSFANHQDNHLPMLEKEVEQIENALQPLHDKGYLEVYKTESLSTSVLSTQSSRFANRIIIFHYGGHAGSEKLVLKNGEGNIEGIVKLLISNPQKAPKLVFLNGCSTQSQVKYFLGNGVSAVIATSIPISDNKAVDFSNEFYKRFADGLTLEEAFNKAVAYLQMKYDVFKNEEVIIHRGFAFEETKAVLPWGLYYNDDKILKWKLPKTNRIRLYIIALIGVILLGLIGLGLFKNHLAQQPFNFKVNVHGKAGKQDLILKEQGMVVLRLPEGYPPLKQKINENGEALFEKVDAELLDNTIEIYIEHNQPYQSIVPDSLYELKREGSINLTVQLNNLHQLTGKIIDFKTEQGLDGVRISVHPKVFTYTNEFGEFILEIPELYQKKYQQVNLDKIGYQSDTFNKIAIHTQNRFEYALKPLQ